MKEKDRLAIKLFGEATELPDDKHSAFLEAACGDDVELRRAVEALIEAYRNPDKDFKLAPAEIAHDALREIEMADDAIAGYRLGQKLGEGGFGVVREAEQLKPVRRRVAVKIVKPGMDTRQVVARFEMERQALAMMNHPNIAKVFDAGATESGRPFFAMELVEGNPITEVCDERNLSVKERIGLFLKVCHAVQYAHQKGIIHRDLKPSNILLLEQDGKLEPKVIDFGIAKAIQGELADKTRVTLEQQRIGTPAYMSPEQAGLDNLDADTRSDIYSLGVVLYELLTGKTPVDAKAIASDAVMRAIREADVPKPSTKLESLAEPEQKATAFHRGVEPSGLKSALRGDLDWILTRTLEKNRDRRYKTASDLAVDIERHLTNEPVHARPPSLLDRFHKLYRRRKLAVTTTAIGVLSTLVVAVVWIRGKQEVAQQNAAYRSMLFEAARSDLVNADDNLRLGRQPKALAYFARALKYDPQCTMLVAEKVIAAMNLWQYPLPENILIGHAADLTGAQFSPDGTRILTTSEDKTARVWESASGRLMAILIGHQGKVSSARFSPDGSRIVTTSDDKTARVWDTVSGTPLVTLAGHTAWVFGAQFSRDGATIVTASADKTARVWDSATGRALLTLSGHQLEVMAARFSPDGAQIVTASWDKTARVWDATTGKTLLTLAVGEGQALSAAFSSDGARIVTGSSDETFRVWEVATGKLMVEIPAHGWGAQFNLDGTRIIRSGRGLSTAEVWDSTTGALVLTLAGHDRELYSSRYNRDGTRIITASRDKTARVWDAAGGKVLAILAGHEAEVTGAEFSNDGTRIVTTSARTARVWAVGGSKAPTILSGHESGLTSAEFSPDGMQIVTGSADKTALIWDTLAEKPLKKLSGHEGEVLSAQFSRDGTRIVTGSEDKTARMWDAATGEALVILPGHKGRVLGAQFSPEGARIVTASEDKTARVWDTVTGKTVATILGDAREDWVASAQFSPDGRRIATALPGNTTRIWDAATGNTVDVLSGHEDAVWSARFSADGRRIVTGSNDRTARVWDTATGKSLVILSGHEDVVWNAAFSPDGQRVVTASDDKTARIWDAATGKLVAILAGHEGGVSDARFSPDGMRIVTASDDATARVWTVLPLSAGALPEWFPDFLRYVAQMRLNAHGEMETLTPTDWLALRESLRGVSRRAAGQDTAYLRALRVFINE